jgi:hypothetical protein
VPRGDKIVQAGMKAGQAQLEEKLEQLKFLKAPRDWIL